MYLLILTAVCSVLPLLGAFRCAENSQFYIECSDLYTLNQSTSFCSQYGMNLINMTNSTTMSGNINQTLAEKNCTNNFWYTLDGQTGLIGNIGSLTGGVLCSVIPLLGLYCVSTPVTVAATICIRTEQVQIQQKCVSTEPNPRADLQTAKFVRNLMYAAKLDYVRTASRSQCNSLCSRTDNCLGITYQNFNCTLYL